ncbi:MAG TPA: MbcA/ParS/Xre antitoxin family protein [Bryocella sp.]|nr:MbcA/ParS/Xre antitoxin family protein [Bryocella sp.]
MREFSPARLIPLGPEVAPGYQFDKAADLTDAAERERLSPTAIRAFVKICEKWGLSEPQARALLGGIASSTLHAWRADPVAQKLSQDTLVRISLVIGIYKALHIYFSKAWADRWVRLGNRGELFGGRAPIDFMIRHGQPGMLEVRRMLDAWRGGR